jgi:O-antigen/teichoic acid export membrane protein
MLITVLTGFLVAPYLVHHLQETAYGLWILIASMSGYFGLLDLGVRGSVGRYVAYYRARDEHEDVNRTLSTSLAILAGVGILALAATFVVLLFFFRIFDVPPENVGVARTAIVIIGINLAITFPVTVFDGVLWGFERFDLINIVDIPTVLIRTGLTFWLVHGPGDIATLAWITLITTAANEVAKAMVAFWVEPRLRVSIGRCTVFHAKQLYGYGFWQFLLQIARQTSSQIGPLLVGWIVAVAAVTPFSIASRLLSYAGGFMVSATGANAPRRAGRAAGSASARRR